MKKTKRNKNNGHAIKNSLNGITNAIENEHNLVYIMFYIILVLGLSIYYEMQVYEMLTLIVCFGLTFSFELINTGMEALTDLVTTKENDLAKIAKDSSSAALFISTIITIMCTIVIFLPKILESFGII